MLKNILIIMFFFVLSSCSWVRQDKTADWSAEELYAAAKEEMQGGGYKSAIDYYTKLLARYPFGKLAHQAALDLIYVYYRNGDTEESLAEIERFIKTYPEHPVIDYVYYMRGIVIYEQDSTIFDRITPTNLAQTETDRLVKAFNAFDDLVKRFPDSRYSEDARYRMLYLRNIVAQHELEVALHYLRLNAYHAAIKRGQYLIEHYETSPSAPYALAVMTRGYQELGQDSLAQDTRRILALNFPQLLRSEEIDYILHDEIKNNNDITDVFRGNLKIN